MEEWRDIEGYEGYYQVSNIGNVRSLDRTLKGRDGVWYPHKGVKMKPTTNKNGYQYVVLKKDGTFKGFTVHGLVARAFLERDPLRTEINHKDGIKTNNNVSNLEWVTHSENEKHAIKNGLVDFDQIRKIGIEKRKKRVKQIDASGNVIAVYKSATDASKALGIYRRSIARCCAGEYKHAGGYRWQFA